MKPVLTVLASYLGSSRRRLRLSLRGSCKKPAICAGVKEKKNLSPERVVRPGSAWEDVAKKITAICVGVKAKEKLEPRARSASRLSLGRCCKKITAICAGTKAKEKLEPRARSASRLSLGGRLSYRQIKTARIFSACSRKPCAGYGKCRPEPSI